MTGLPDELKSFCLDPRISIADKHRQINRMDADSPEIADLMRRFMEENGI